MQRKHERVELTCRSMFAIYLMAAIVLLLTPDRVSAQGLPMLPDPIDSRELMDYADRLTLSRQQKLAILPMHDAYFQRFARLRERDIQKFQDELIELIATINPMDLSIPPRDVIEALVRRYDQILVKVRTVDRQLFNDIRTILTDEQMLLVDLVSRARERSLYRQVTLEVGGEFNPGSAVDLSDMVRDLDLPASAKVGVNPMLRSYEAALLEGVRDLHKEIKKIVTVVLDTIDNLGLRDMDIMEMGERFNDEEFQESIMALFDEASRPFQKATSDISRLNFTTYQRLAKVLKPDTRRKLRDNYFRRVYSRSVRDLEGTNEHFRHVLKLEGLSEEQRDQIIQLHETFHLRNKPVILEIAGLIEDSRRYRTIMQLNDDVLHQDKKIENLMERREQITTSTKKSVAAILGPDLVAKIGYLPTAEHSKWEQVREQYGEDVARQFEESGVDIDSLDLPTKKKVEPKGLAPIPPRRIEEYAHTLKLDDSQRLILDSLYDDYRVNFDELLSPSGESPESRSQEEGKKSDRFRQALEKTKGKIERFKTIQELDASFFTNIELVMEGDQTKSHIEYFSLKRRRNLLLQSLANPYRFNNELKESKIDLTQLLDDLDLMDSDLESTKATLHEYEKESVVMLEQLNMVTMEMARLEALSEVMNRERPDSSQALKSRKQKNLNSFSEARSSLKSINRYHLAKLQDKLSEDSRWSLTRSYNEKTYPEIYEDKRSAETLIDSVLGLDDLSGSQREGILQLATEYREYYHSLSQEMVDIVSQREDQSFNGTIPIDMILRELEHEKLKYERNETSERTRTRIELLLSEEQMMLAKRSVHDS